MTINGPPEFVRYITSLEEAGQLGKIRGTTSGVEVEILRQGFGKAKNRSYRIFDLQLQVINDVCYIRTKEEFQRVYEAAAKGVQP